MSNPASVKLWAMYRHGQNLNGQLEFLSLKALGKTSALQLREGDETSGVSSDTGNDTAFESQDHVWCLLNPLRIAERYMQLA